jgi:hypothetical protein
MAKRKRKSNHVPLIVEPHPEDYNGYPFITLIQYRDTHQLTVIDNANDKIITAFVLDRCSPEGLDEEAVVAVIAKWYDGGPTAHPLSFEFSKLGVSGVMSSILRTYNIDFVTRVIGPLPMFNMTENKTVRRRRRKQVPAGVELHNFVSF